MAISYLFDPNKQFQDKNGVNNVGGYLYVFINDSDDHAPTYCNFTGTLNPERIVLDNNGRAVVIVDELKTYRIEVYDRSGNMLWSQYPVRPTNVIYGDYNVYNADIYGTPDEIDIDVETSASGVKKFTIKLANAVKTVIGNIQDKISSIVETVSTKADKVQGATAGNLAALDANGNLADSGKKTADFKTKQTAVSVTGGSLKGVASMSQNANGEVTLTLNDIQDGTTAQKGVVQLQDSIGPTESATDKAVTPHAVREAISTAVSSAYHAAGTKTVAQLTSSLLVAGNEGSVYNITDSGTTTSDFVDGAGHPINAGDNVGVCDVGGGVYKFDLLSGFVDLSDYLTKTGNASNTTSVLTKNASDGSSMASGSKLSVLFTAISDFFASLKALAFKDKVSDSDISGTISDSHIASATTWNGKADKANITGATKCKITYNSQGIVTAGADLSASDIPSLAASKITSGTFGTDRIADDAITAAKVKDNETLPVNIGGKAATAVKNEDSVNLIYGMYTMEASSHAIPDLLDELRVLHGARCGSVYITSTYTKDNVTIELGWYNFEYIPHRGDAAGDSRNFGTLLLSGMTVSTTFYVFRYSSSNISNLWQLTNAEGSYPNMSVGNATVASTVALRMDSGTYIDISWANVSWSDFCGIGTDSLVQKVFGSNYKSTERTITVIGRISGCPDDFETNTGIPATAINNGTLIGVKSRDVIFVKFFTNAKYGGQFPVYEITFGLSAASGIRSIMKNVVISSTGVSLPGGVGSTSTPVYVNDKGQVQPCEFQVNFGTPIAGANVLNIITA